jgi:hypothetical protein
VHADLIVGLPGEDIESFGRGFDRLVELRPQEIQVGLLKRLRGTPIVRHDAEWGMIYSPHAPYEILQTRLIDFAAMQRLRRFSRYWDLIANSGNFVETTPLIWERAAAKTSPFQAFLRMSDWLFARTNRTHAMALPQLMELVFEFLTRELLHEAREVAQAMWRNYTRGGRRSDLPGFLRPFIDDPSVPRRKVSVHLPPRQARHLA